MHRLRSFVSTVAVASVGVFCVSSSASAESVHPGAVTNGGETTQIGLSVRPGTLSWRTEAVDLPAPARDETRLISGVVVDARGDGQPWSLIVSVAGIDGARLRPNCAVDRAIISGDVALAQPGSVTILNGRDILVCSAGRGHSGGRFLVTVDVAGLPPQEAHVSLELA